jgi:hypothetical protein
MASRRRSSSVRRTRRPPNCAHRMRFSSIRYVSASRSWRSNQPIRTANHIWRADMSITGPSLYHRSKTGPSLVLDRAMGQYGRAQTGQAAPLLLGHLDPEVRRGALSTRFSSRRYWMISCCSRWSQPRSNATTGAEDPHRRVYAKSVGSIFGHYGVGNVLPSLTPVSRHRRLSGAPDFWNPWSPRRQRELERWSVCRASRKSQPA